MVKYNLLKIRERESKRETNAEKVICYLCCTLCCLNPFPLFFLTMCFLFRWNCMISYEHWLAGVWAEGPSLSKFLCLHCHMDTCWGREGTFRNGWRQEVGVWRPNTHIHTHKIMKKTALSFCGMQIYTHSSQMDNWGTWLSLPATLLSLHKSPVNLARTKLSRRSLPPWSCYRCLWIWVWRFKHHACEHKDMIWDKISKVDNLLILWGVLTFGKIHKPYGVLAEHLTDWTLFGQ